MHRLADAAAGYGRHLDPDLSKCHDVADGGGPAEQGQHEPADRRHRSVLERVAQRVAGVLAA